MVDNIYLIQDVLEVSSSLSIDTGLISLDQEKAFDRVEHNFLWKVMESAAPNKDSVPAAAGGDAVGPALTDAQELGSLLGIQSVRVAQRILELWRQRLSGKEKSLITEYSRKTSEPDPNDPFPEILLSPVLEEASGPLLVTCNPTNLSLHKADNKTLYRNCVKSMNRRGLSGRPLTAWTSRLGADDGATPQWTVLYKPPLKKRTAYLQWRILHAAIASNAFISVLNLAASNKCPFCDLHETIFHIFTECKRLTELFTLLTQVFSLFNETLSQRQ
ncbi:hypothetical protein L3Q82_019088, partial [Scortum barcoo]